MTKVVVHIGRLVVHGNGSFVADAFSEHLRQEIGRHIGAGLSGPEIAQRLQAGASAIHRDRRNRPRSRDEEPARAGSAPESAAASQVARKLVK
jgi:transposase